MSEYQADNRRIAKNTLFLYFRMAIMMLISIYSSRVILRSLGVVDFGIESVVAGFVSLFSFLNSSLTASIQRFVNFKKAQDGIKGVQDVFCVSVVTQILLAVVFALLLESVGSWYIQHKLVVPPERLDAAFFIFHLTVLSSIVVILEVPFSAIVISYERMNVYAYVSILNAVLRLVAALSIPLFAYDRLMVYGIMLLVISIIESSIYVIYTRVNFKEVFGKFKVEKPLFKDMMSFSGWNMFGAFSFIIKDQGINMILNWFFGPVVNAARGVSMQISSGLKNFVPGVFTAARPQLVEAYAQQNQERVNSIFYSCSKLCFLVLFLVALPVACEIDYILKIWLADNVPQYTNVFTVWILAIALVDILNTPVSMVVLATGKVKVFNLASSLIGFAALPIAYFALKTGAEPQSVYICVFGISALIQLVSLILLQIIANIRLSEYFTKIVLPLGLVMTLSIPLGILSIHLMSPSFLRLVITTAVTMSCVAGASYLFALNASEKMLVKKAIAKIIRR